MELSRLDGCRGVTRGIIMTDAAEHVELDELDVNILNKLLQDGRKSFRKIAEAVDSTPATVINRVDRMQEEGVIRGYSADIDYQKLGYQAIAAIEIVVRGDSIDEVENHIKDHNNVVSAYTITGDTDMLLLVKFETREELTGFVKDYLVGSDQVKKTITHMTLDVLKENADPQLEP